MSIKETNLKENWWGFGFFFPSLGEEPSHAERSEDGRCLHGWSRQRKGRDSKITSLRRDNEPELLTLPQPGQRHLCCECWIMSLRNSAAQLESVLPMLVSDTQTNKTKSQRRVTWYCPFVTRYCPFYNVLPLTLVPLSWYFIRREELWITFY